jgi:uncharacterized protein (DUF302 family)
MMRTWIISLLLFLSSGAGAAEPVLLEATSPYGFDETITRLKTAISNQNLRVLRDQDLSRPSVAIRALYFCDFELLKSAYAADRRIGYTLPCRITVTQQSSGVVLSTVNPAYAAHAAHLNTEGPCDEIKSKILEIMWEATL